MYFNEFVLEKIEKKKFVKMIIFLMILLLCDCLLRLERIGIIKINYRFKRFKINVVLSLYVC